MNLWLLFAAQHVMSINYETWIQFRDHPRAYPRRIALNAKTRALIAYDQTVNQDFRSLYPSPSTKENA